jgi:hypothetical protein
MYFKRDLVFAVILNGDKNPKVKDLKFDCGTEDEDD